MITNRGKTFFKNYLANQAGQLAGAASFGIGNVAAGAADERLQFEFARVPLTVVTYDLSANRLVFKGSLPQEVTGTIYEVGLWTGEVAGSNPSDNRIITTFDSETEDWTNVTYSSVNTRIGIDNLRHSVAANGSSTSTLNGLILDFIENPSNDTFTLAYNCSNANVATIRVRLKTDGSNFYDLLFTPPGAGYYFSTMAKGSANVTGAPDWADINSIEVTTVAKAAGSTIVDFDGLRIDDNSTFNLDYGMIARVVPATPVVKPAGRILDFEYSLLVNV